MKYNLILAIIFLSVSINSYAQINQDFSTSFLSIWKGDTGNFKIDNYELRLNDAEAGNSFLVIKNKLLQDSVTWSFKVKMDFNPSGSNFCRVYLSSNHQNLNEPLAGYFILIGGKNDNVSFYRQEGNTDYLLIEGEYDLLDNSTNSIEIKISKTNDDVWDLWVDPNLSGNYILQGSIHDDNIVNSDYFGIYCTYTVTRSDKFYFDDIRVGGDLILEESKVTSKKQLKLLFNQPIDTGFTYEVIGEDGWRSGWIESQSKESINLPFELSTGTYFLDIKNLKDSLFKNSYPLLETAFSYEELELINYHFSDSLTLNLAFNQRIDSASKMAILFQDEMEIEDFDLSDSNNVVLKMKDAFNDLRTYTINIQNLLNLDLNSSLDTSFQIIYRKPIQLNEVAVISDSSLTINFDREILNLFSNEIKEFSFLSSDSSRVLIELKTKLKEDIYDLKIDSLVDINGLIWNQVPVISFTYLPLKVIEFKQVDQKSIELTFNQSIDTSGIKPEDFQLEYFGEPENLVFKSDSILILEYNRLSNVKANLTIISITNLSGNAKISGSIEIAMSSPTKFKDILISEFMADPVPSRGLPESEFVEIFNSSDFPINVGGFTINSKKLPDFKLQSKDFLLIYPLKDSSYYEVYKAIGLSSFDVLSNSGESIILEDSFGNLIDSLTYDIDWYRSDSISDGGFSLELNLPNYRCHSLKSWSFSKNPLGGTPGFENSEFDFSTDVYPPEILEVLSISQDSIQIIFNESLESFGGNIWVNEYQINDLSRLNANSILLILKENLASEYYHTISIDSVEDCNLNVATINDHRFYFDITPPQIDKILFRRKDQVELRFSESLKKDQSLDEEQFIINKELAKNVIRSDTHSEIVFVELQSDLVDSSDIELVYSGISDEYQNVAELDTFETLFHKDIHNLSIVNAQTLKLKFRRFADPTTIFNKENFHIDGLDHPIEIYGSKYDSLEYFLVFKNGFKENRSYNLEIININSKEGILLVTPEESFIYDSEPPIIKSVYYENDTSIFVIFNEELELFSAINPTNYLIDSVQIEESILISRDTILLTFNVPLESEQEIDLKYIGLSDLQGNEVHDIETFHFIFDLQPPILEDINQYSPDQLKLRFHESVDYKDAFIWIDGKLTDSLSYYFDDLCTLLIGCDNYLDANELEIKISGIKDFNNNQRNDTLEINKSFKNSLTESFYTSHKNIYLQFSHSTIFQNFQFQLSDNNVSTIDSVNTYSCILNLENEVEVAEINQLIISEDGLIDQKLDTTISLKFNPHYKNYEFTDQNTLELRFEVRIAEIDQSNFKNPLIPDIAFISHQDSRNLRLYFESQIPDDSLMSVCWDSIYSIEDHLLPEHCAAIYRDTKGPTVSRVLSDHGNKIFVYFNEPISPLDQPNHQIKIENQQVIEAELLGDTVLMIVMEDLVFKQDYQLELYSIEDFFRNVSERISFLFTYSPPVLPKIGNIFINEIMFDPSASGNLPNIEYVEIVNVSKHSFNLKYLTFSDTRSAVILPDFQIHSGDYILLGPQNLIDFYPENKVVSVSSFPTLNNDKDSLSLRLFNGEIIDQISYSTAEFGSIEGKSLEKVNPKGWCTKLDNWGYSNDEKGGTPNQKNSIYNDSVDLRNPEIVSYYLNSEKQLVITFDEMLDTSRLEEVKIISDQLRLKRIQVINDSILVIEFKEKPQFGRNYQIKLDAVFDCSGKILMENLIEFGLPVSPKFNDLVITEVMFDPDPVKSLPNLEYIEILNKSDSLISLEGVKFSDNSGFSSFIGGKIKPGEYLIICPGDLGLDINYNRIDSWRSLNNSGEEIKLWCNEKLIFKLDYEKLIENLSINTGGTSLEMIDYFVSCKEIGNWKYSIDESGGTPGRLNSVISQLNDKIPPQLVEVEKTDSVTYQLTFNEQLNLNLSLEKEVSPWMSYESTNSIQVKFERTLPQNSIFELNLEDIEDCVGNTNSFLINLYSPAAEIKDLFISEVLYDPYPGGVDFVEFYNASDNIYDLQNIVFSVGSENYQPFEKSEILLPKSFLAITKDTANVGEYYELGNVKQVDRLPNFPNGEAVFSIREESLIDSVFYSDKFHSIFINDTEGISLERNYYSGYALKDDHWFSSSAFNHYATPGYKNSIDIQHLGNEILSIEPKMFIPNSARADIQPFTNFSFKKQDIGLMVSIRVFDQHGFLVKTISNGELVNAYSNFTWEGSTDSQNLVSPGRYIVYYEAWSEEGQLYKGYDTVVVGWND